MMRVLAIATVVPQWKYDHFNQIPLHKHTDNAIFATDRSHIHNCNGPIKPCDYGWTNSTKTIVYTTRAYQHNYDDNLGLKKGKINYYGSSDHKMGLIVDSLSIMEKNLKMMMAPKMKMVGSHFRTLCSLLMRTQHLSKCCEC